MSKDWRSEKMIGKGKSYSKQNVTNIVEIYFHRLISQSLIFILVSLA